jgi:hypothetical protein
MSPERYKHSRFMLIYVKDKNSVFNVSVIFSSDDEFCHYFFFYKMYCLVEIK